jgi:hypothetical protein
MKFLMPILVAAFIGFLCFAGYGLASMNEKNDGQCYAPCTVNFSGQMAEDEFGIDYRGHGARGGELHVFRTTPTP